MTRISNAFNLASTPLILIFFVCLHDLFNFFAKLVYLCHCYHPGGKIPSDAGSDALQKVIMHKTGHLYIFKINKNKI